MVWFIIVALVRRRKMREAFAAHPDRYRPVSIDQALIQSHSLLGILFHQRDDPFSRGSRALVLVLNLVLQLLCAALMPLMLPSAYDRPFSISVEQLRMTALSLALSTLLSLVLGAPLIKKGASSVLRRTRLATQVTACLVIFFAGTCAVCLLILPGLLGGYRRSYSSVLVLFAFAQVVSIMIVEPVIASAIYFVLGKNHVRIIAPDEVAAFSSVASIAPATAGDDDDALASKTDLGTPTID